MQMWFYLHRQCQTVLSREPHQGRSGTQSLYPGEGTELMTSRGRRHWFHHDVCLDAACEGLSVSVISRSIQLEVHDVTGEETHHKNKGAWLPIDRLHHSS